jgi:hypothetical protein
MYAMRGQGQPRAATQTEPSGDTDRISKKIEGIASESVTGGANDRISKKIEGRQLAEALDLRQHMRDIVDNYPGAEFIHMDPPIIHFKNFMSPEECGAMIEAGKPGLTASTGTGALKNGHFERTTIAGRTSYNSWCMGPCASEPTIQRIDRRIANATGFSYKNMEYYQILRYDGPQEYQAHTDWIEQQKGQPSGPRIFTFFLYLNNVEQQNGGATWFPQAVNSTKNTPALGSGAGGGGASSSIVPRQPTYSKAYDFKEINLYYQKYNTPKGRETLAKPKDYFADMGVRVQPTQGSAVMWPNVDLDNVFKQNPGTLHAAEELIEGSLKWSANAWIHLRDFRTPHAAGLTG